MEAFLQKMLIIFIVCHGAPADHFATFAEILHDRGYDVQIYACGAALKKLEEMQVTVHFPFSAPLSEERGALGKTDRSEL